MTRKSKLRLYRDHANRQIQRSIKARKAALINQANIVAEAVENTIALLADFARIAAP